MGSGQVSSTGPQAVRIIPLAVGALAANCYILIHPASGQACIIDPGAEPQRILRALPQGVQVRYVVATHAHFDHVGAVAAVRQATGAPFLLHPSDAELLRRAPEAAELYTGERLLAPPEPDAALAHGQHLPLGDLAIEVRHTPGHSPGSVSLWVPAEPPVVFSGDALFAGSIGRTDLPGGDFRQLVEAIRRELLSLEDRTVVYPGHGPTTTVGQERRTNPFLAGPGLEGLQGRKRPEGLEGPEVTG